MMLSHNFGDQRHNLEITAGWNFEVMVTVTEIMTLNQGGE
jgi:hypothetical protein